MTKRTLTTGLKMKTTIRFSFLASLIAALPWTVLATTTAADSGGYSATDATPFSFIDVSGSGGASVLSGIDDGAVAVTIPFSFTFYGTNYTNVCISSNGALYFVTDPNTCNQFNPGGTLNDFSNVDLSAGAGPGDLPGVYPFWTDLSFADAGSGSAFYQTIGTPGNRRLIIQWQNAFPQGDALGVNFEVILAEGTNSITFQYATVTLGSGDPNNNGTLATVAIRNAGGQSNGQQTQWSYASPVLQNNYAILFGTSSAPGAPVLTSPLNGATGVSVGAPLTWNAGAGATSYDVYFGTANPPAQIVAPGVTNFTFNPQAEVQGATYYWKVAAKNSSGTTASAVSQFTTLAPAVSSGPLQSNVFWVVPQAITYGTPLGSAQLDAVADVVGNFIYNPPLGTVLHAGTQTLSTQFTPGAVGYLGASASVKLVVNPAPQTINFASIPNRTTDDSTVAVTASASSGLPVALAVVSGPATLSGSTLTILGPGTITLKATQPGNNDYLAAASLMQSFSVTSGSVTITGVVNSASYSTSALASGAFGTIFGRGFAAQVSQATTANFPTQLGGVTVTITDSAGNQANGLLYYVSPTQVNFVVPDGLVKGAATVLITGSTGQTGSLTLNIAPIAPALFTADASGKGTAAAVAVAYASDGSTQVLCATSPTCAATPIDLGSSGTSVYLLMFGTGIRGRTSLAGVTVTANGNPLQVSYAGVQPTYLGLDQVNVLLDRSLIGAGTVALQVTIDGVAANPVTIAIK